MRPRVVVLTAAVLLLASAPAGAHPLDGKDATQPRFGQAPSPSDLFAVGQGEGQTIARVATQRNPEPPFTPTPQADCLPGSRPEPGVQGRVPAGAATDGLWCNVTVRSRHGQSGGFKVLRYRDTTGRECAYYDTALLFPLNVFKADVESIGVTVLDMTDPAKPVFTDRLVDPAMMSPHESVVLNPARGLIAAVSGNPATYPGQVAIYDASRDCRKPVLTFSGPIARLGHESGFSPDGRTFYATSVNAGQITAIDVTDPAAPEVLWLGRLNSHGVSLNAAGTRAYGTDTGGQLVIADTSEIAARKPNPRVREISRLTWRAASIPQNAMPFERDGRSYLLEVDEYTEGTARQGDRDAVGAARIIDITDEARPRSIANLRLEVNQPAEHAAAAGDPGAFSAAQGYAAHYCSIPEDGATVVACSFITSGVRVFDISDLERPREIAYFVAPTRGRAENGFQPSSFAMSQPVVVPERREVWYSDGTAGFYVLKVRDEVWPAASAKVVRVCASRRAFGIRTRLPRGARVRSVRMTVAGRRVRAGRRAGRYVRGTVDLRGRRKGVVTVRVRAVLRDGRIVSDVRRYRPCTRR